MCLNLDNHRLLCSRNHLFIHIYFILAFWKYHWRNVWNVGLTLRRQLLFSSYPHRSQDKLCENSTFARKKRFLCGWIINPSPLWIFKFKIVTVHWVFFFASNSIVRFLPHLTSFMYHSCIVPSVLACSGLQRSPWTSGGLPTLRGDGVDSWGVCRRSGRSHPAAGCRHHHH